MTVTLLRHTKPDVADGVCYGQLDLDVAGSFEAEVAAILSGLAPPKQIISSPLLRCKKLGRALAHAWSLPLAFDDGIKEMDFGAWEGKRWSDLPRGELDAWAADFFHARPHGGESVAMLTQRSRSALRAIAKEGEQTLVVTHAGVIKAALAQGETPAAYQTAIDYGEAVSLPLEGLLAQEDMIRPTQKMPPTKRR